MLGVVEELDRKAKGVRHADGRPDTSRGARFASLDAHPEPVEVVRSLRDVIGRPHPIGERCERWNRSAAQHERVVQVLLEGAQVDGVLVFEGDHESEHTDVESARRREVAHDQLGVGRADDVRGRGGVHGSPLQWMPNQRMPNRGVCTGPSVMCTACWFV